MKTFKELYESLNSPAKWKLIGNSIEQRRYEWYIDGLEYELTADRLSGSTWSVDFSVDQAGSGTFTTKATGTGNEIKVFATVLDILKDFIDTDVADEITFIASKQDGDKETGRIKLYKRMLKKFIPKNWTSIVKDDGKHTVFSLKSR